MGGHAQGTSPASGYERFEVDDDLVIWRYMSQPRFRSLLGGRPVLRSYVDRPRRDMDRRRAGRAQGSIARRSLGSWFGAPGEGVHAVAQHDPVAARLQIAAHHLHGSPPLRAVEWDLSEDLGDVPLHRRLVAGRQLGQDTPADRRHDRGVLAAHLLEGVSGAHAHVLIGVEHTIEQLAHP